ncbi:hypothetical protein C3941_22430 [Kaistia algarum]|uniref:hypothetical protein n=1 Tax=Kaistia algarum TaxID=2083279 RepID=UPI000CE7F9F5|nr:hypothetical protein [Kaistia algarum]MCX5515275.1 hypothetical protein [Kaistia algarum]PPE77708.1 hypothetical protein C3941_22430 [Kaistia algarum]
MAELLVTGIDDALWKRFLAFAERQGKSAEELLHELIVDYAVDWDSPPDVPHQGNRSHGTKARRRGQI